MSERIETYLDRLFDCLAGTGSRGRRALIEAESHLNEATERLVAEGCTHDQAEAEALRRFGAPEQVAHAVRVSAKLSWSEVAQRTFASAWLFAGAVALAFAASGLFNAIIAGEWGAGAVARDALDAVYGAERCADLQQTYTQAASCRDASILHHVEEAVTQPLIVGVLGAMLLAAFFVARRSRALRWLAQLPPSSMVSVAGAAGFAAAALALTIVGVDRMANGDTIGVAVDFGRAVAAALASLCFLPWAARELRLRHG